MITRRPLNTSEKPSNVVSLSGNRKTKDGKRNLPKTAYAPGISGNPNGRPKLPAEFAVLMKEHAIEAAHKLLEWARSDDPRVSPQACIYIINRAYGAPTQMTEVSGPNGQPFQAPAIQVNFVASMPDPQTIDAEP
jgi:hypothetical protein